MTLSWNPRRRGIGANAVYCSPACGRGCLASEFRAAQRFGTDIAACLGTGWKMRTWENLGWHGEGVFYHGAEVVRVSGSRGAYYCGTDNLGIIGHGGTPRAAVHNAWKAMRDRAQKATAAADIVLHSFLAGAGLQ